MSLKKKHESNTDNSNSGNKTYSQDDNAKFEKLMNFPRMSTVASKPASPSGDNSTAYSDNDRQAFEKLTAQADSSKGARQRRVVNADDLPSDGYSDSDNGQFDELSSAFDDWVKTMPASPSQHQAKPSQDTTGYSESDKLGFRRLMVGRLGADDHQAEEKEFQNAYSEGETSFIKIIDFDKERIREKSKMRQVRANIKIRYFD